MKTALVTGSAKRLGRELALRLAEAGYFTFVHYLASRTEAQAVLAEIEKRGGAGRPYQRGHGFQTGRRRHGRQGQRPRWAGWTCWSTTWASTAPVIWPAYGVEDFETTLLTNLVGPFHLIQKLSPLIPRGGSIVNIGYSGVESLTGSTHNTAYLISKSGLLILTKSLAQAMGPRGIRVNMISPGILDNSVELPEKPEETIPLGRLGACSDICDALSFLVGGQAGYVTGTNLDVAGGYMLGLKELDVNRGA